MTAGEQAPARDVAATGSGVPGDGPERPMGLRLARVHLRVGSLPLARAELEAYAGRGALDEDALLDLAEVRWRTGDLAGAGEAANALLSRGREDALALVIAAEAVAAAGRPGEARRLAGRALEAVDGPLDPFFAGMPRSLIWPGDPIATGGLGTDAGEPIAASPARAAGSAEGAPASAAAAEAFAGGLAALGAGDTGSASLRLGVALRLEPTFAQGVLDALGPRTTEPALALLAGDALRLLGRESEALEAFDRARGHAPGA
jgi:tetratricopeptide (TPR) repeat protein